jgi:hypothetical protein
MQPALVILSSMTSAALPPPESIRQLIESCRVELRELKVLLRASEAAERARSAREQRQQQLPEGVRHAR